MQPQKQRPALLPLDHPLANGNELSKPKKTTTIQEQITYLYEHHQITNLMNEYAYQLDYFMVEPKTAERTWQNLFTEDCTVTYPFGTHYGREKLGKWAFEAESRFCRMQHLSSNFSIVVHNEVAASARSTLIAVCGLDECDIGKTFSEGGYYYWDFKKCDTGDWKIERLVLDVLWTSGDDLGLNSMKNGEGDANYPTPE